MENYKFSTLPYQRPDLEARRTQLARWQDAVEQAESFDALRALLFEMDRANGELSTQCAIAHIRHTLDTRDAFYEAEIALPAGHPAHPGRRRGGAERGHRLQPLPPRHRAGVRQAVFRRHRPAEKAVLRGQRPPAPAGVPPDQRVSEDHGRRARSPSTARP